MADTVNVGGVNYSTDDVTTLNGSTVAAGTNQTQRIKVQYGDDNSARDVSKSFPLPVGNTAQVSGTFAASDAVVAAPVGDGTLVSGSSTAGSVIALAVPDGLSAWTMLIKSFGTGFIYSEASANSTNGTDGDWVEVKGRRTGTAVGIESVAYAYSSNGYYRGNDAGFTWLRARFIGTGTPTVQITGSTGTGAVFLNSGIPAGSSTLGNVGIVASSSFSMTTGTLSTATVPGNPNTTSTTSATVANVSTAGNVTVYLFGGTYTALTLAFEVSPDGTNWFGINASRMDGVGTDITPSFTAATVRAWEIVMPGVVYFRVRATAITQTAAPTVVIAPGGMVYDPSPVVTGTVNVNPTGGTSVVPVAGVAANQTPPASGGTGTISITASAIVTATALIAAPAAGLSIYVTDMEGSNSGSTGTLVSLFEGTTNLRYARFMAASGGGFVTNLRTPWKLPAATAVGYAVSAATTSAFLTLSYFVAP